MFSIWLVKHTQMGWDALTLTCFHGRSAAG
jgi:hypothetical protein